MIRPNKNLTLCIAYDALVSIPALASGVFPFNFSEVHSNDYQFLNREIVDDANIPDVAEEYPHFATYLVLKSGDKYLTYQRGSGGSETRLTQRSMGIGGHVDLNDIVAVGGQKYILRGIQYAAVREIKEELGINLQIPLVFNHVIKDVRDAVGSVHLGIPAVIDVGVLGDSPVFEDNSEIADAKWQTLEELQNTSMEYEGWSQLLIAGLLSITPIKAQVV